MWALIGHGGVVRGERPRTRIAWIMEQQHSKKRYKAQVIWQKRWSNPHWYSIEENPIYKTWQREPKPKWITKAKASLPVISIQS